MLKPRISHVHNYSYLQIATKDVSLLIMKPFVVKLFFAARSALLPLSSKNTRNLQTSAERLVEQHSGLKF